MLIQEAVAEFMLEGHFVRHIRAMRKHYAARRDALVAAFDRHMTGLMTLGVADCGLHAVAYLAEHLEEVSVVATAQALGLGVFGLSAEYLALPPRPGLVIGFANVEPRQ